MSREIPVLRVTHGQVPGDWSLVPDGNFRPSLDRASPEATKDGFRMWNASVESIICQEFPSFGRPHCPCANEMRNPISYAKENFQPKPMGLGLCADQSSGGVSNSFSPKKRGILTVNSGLCNGSEAALKRQRQYEPSFIKETDVQPMFQTASMKPVQISSSAMQKAKALLEFDDVGLCTPNQHKKQPLNNSLSNVSSTKRKLSGSLKRQVDNGAVNGLLKQSMDTPTCLFQTATGKSVAISHAGMQKAMSLFGKIETSVHALNSNQFRTATVDWASLRSDLGQNLNTNMLQTALEQPIAMSRTAVRQVGKLSNEENLSFPLESSLTSSSGRFETRQHSAEVSTCLFQTATGKAVSISNAGMHRAAALLGDTELSKVDLNPGMNLFEAAQGQSVSVSSTAVRQAAKPLGEDNLSFPLEAPLSSPPLRFVTGKGQSVSVSSSAMKRAKDLLGGELEDTDITASACLINGAEHNSQRLFETTEGHLIKVSSGSIQRARMLLKDRTLHTSIGPCVSPFSNLDISGLPSSKGLDALHNSVVQEPKVLLPSRKGALSKKFVPCFKAPRRLQPTILPATISHLKDSTQSGKHDFSQLVNVNPLHHSKEKQKISYKDFFKLQPHQDKELGHLTTKEIVSITSETAKIYKFTSTIHGLESIGADEFRCMLLEAGANGQIVTKE